MATKDYILKKGCYDETWADAKKDDAAYPKSGDKYFPKDTVKKVQTLLIKLRFLNTGNDTGYYGDLTEAAIHEFQLASKGQKRSKVKDGRIFFIVMNEITFKGAEDGIYGPETEKELAHWVQNGFVRPLEHFVKGDIDENGVRNGHGERGKDNYHEKEQLTEVQQLLKDIGLDVGRLDGWFWEKTEAAVKWFQECAEKGTFIDAGGKSVVLEDKDRLKGHRPSAGVVDWVKIEMAKFVKEKGLKAPKQPIQKGAKGEIVEEINIRLAGFGGGVPSDTFDDVTEKKVKQFQADYMNMKNPTGIVDEETVKAIDEFGGKFPIVLEAFNTLKCHCGKVCGGFGKGRHKNDYFLKKDGNGKPIPNSEINHKYEYPGIHRSLLWAIRGLDFHLSKETSVSAMRDFFSSGYRCNDHELTIKKETVNHLGKAVDVHYKTHSSGVWITPKTTHENTALCEKIRKVCLKSNVLNAQMQWNGINKFSLESTADGADTWVHVDVRQFNKAYLADRFFSKGVQAMDGKPLLSFL